jgi:flavin reductase (NADH)
MVTAEQFREALACWASGVTVVTTNNRGMLYGITVSSFSSLTLDPPLVLVCVNNQNRMPAMIEESGGFAVSILAKGQQAASQYFARPGRLTTVDFTEIEGEWTASGQPVVKGSMGWLVCALQRSIPEATHTIVVGRVVDTFIRPDAQPLIYFRRAYRTLEP